MGKDDPLATYIADHLAGSRAGIEALEALRDDNAGEPLGDFAASLLREVEADRALLEGLAASLGGGSHPVKEAAAWMAQRASRLKLSRTRGPLGTFEALEMIALGILGKRALWRALAAVAAGEPRLHGRDFEALAARAQSQHDAVEQRRLEAAHAALLPAPA